MISMLSDFGCKDAYVAVMKGVMASIVPEETTCDITHAVPPQDVLAARFNLMMAYPYFPQGTVHLAVVDPGVGSARRAVAIQCASSFLVGPDNGLFSGVLQQERAIMAISLTNSQYWRVRQPSQTFHGRDIFAPVAAHLAKGVSIEALGDRIDPDTLITPDLPPFKNLSGSVQYIDGFGNVITNIPDHIVAGKSWQVTVNTSTQSPCFSSIKTYSDLPPQTIAALVGSHGFIEIACNRGNAASMLGVTIGATVQVSFLPGSD